MGESIKDKQQRICLRKPVGRESSKDGNSATGLGSMSPDLAEDKGIGKKGLCMEK